MRYSDIEARAARKIAPRLKYQYVYYLEYDYTILSEILTRKKNGSRSDTTYSESYIVFDTETSKDHKPEKGAFGRWKTQENHIVCWTITIRAFHTNLCTLRGSRPTELMHCIKLIRQHINGSIVYLFAHNLAYDIVFLRRFFYQEFGYPIKQLNVANHKPLTIKFANGIVLRDSLILAGMSLEKWSNILDVEHKKAVGFWDYDIIRHQNTVLDENELKYVEFDTVATCECLNKLADILGDTVVSLPFTNTGIPRREVRKVGRKNYAKLKFNKVVGDYKEFLILEKIFHGGYVHSNRYKNGVITENCLGIDYKSSYPFCGIAEKGPVGAFEYIGNIDPKYIIDKSERTAFMFLFIAENIRLTDKRFPMPALQYSKCERIINAVKDNGRILRADYVEIWLNEVDLKLIHELYSWDGAICTEVYAAYKDYYPLWFRQVMYDFFKEKCELEYKIKVLGMNELKPAYAQCKSRLNSCYGLTVTKPVKEQIIEVYEDNDKFASGDYYYERGNMEKDYEKYKKNRNEILPYCYGVWITSNAMYNIFRLAMDCIGNEPKDLHFHWIYSDTDSAYSDLWNMEKVNAFNEKIKQKLIDAGFGPVIIEDREYWLGIAEIDDKPHDKFISQGAKRYAYEDDGVIGITVAGVPKCGSKCLNDLSEFKEGFTFKGVDTKKKTLTYIYNEIHIDEYGNECADSIDMNPCDYVLSTVENPLRLDELIIIDEDGNLIINDFDEPYYDWFE